MDPTKALEEQIAFSDLTVELSKNIRTLCNETYKSTKKPPPENELKNLINRAENQLEEYDSLLEKYSGGQREALKPYRSHIKALHGFTEELKVIIKKNRTNN